MKRVTKINRSRNENVGEDFISDLKGIEERQLDWVAIGRSRKYKEKRSIKVEARKTSENIREHRRKEKKLRKRTNHTRQKHRFHE